MYDFTGRGVGGGRMQTFAPPPPPSPLKARCIYHHIIQAVSEAWTIAVSVCFSSRWHCSARKGPYTLRPISQQSPQGGRRNSAKVCLTEHRSFPTSEGGMPVPSFLHFSFLQAVSPVMLWSVYVQKVPQALEHLCLAELQTRSDISVLTSLSARSVYLPVQSICPFITTGSGMPRAVDGSQQSVKHVQDCQLTRHKEVKMDQKENTDLYHIHVLHCLSCFLQSRSGRRCRSNAHDFGVTACTVQLNNQLNIGNTMINLPVEFYNFKYLWSSTTLANHSLYSKAQQTTQYQKYNNQFTQGVL